MSRCINRRFIRIDQIAFIACVIGFLLFPHIDLTVASNYFIDGEFIYGHNPVVRFIYWLFARIHFVYLLIFIAGIIWASIRSQRHLRKKFYFLTLCLILGPGILVNTLLKDNSVGRPRPQHIEQFGGTMTFSPVFHYSGQCKKNCSFVSGHAAIGFFIMALAWVTGRRRWLTYGVLLGAIVGFVRIVQGGHFLSDIVFAGWFCYFLYALLARLFGLSLATATKKSPLSNTNEPPTTVK